MKIMVVGGGGREHAIIKKLKENKNITEIFALPGNGGIAADATCINIGAKDIEKAEQTLIDVYKERQSNKKKLVKNIVEKIKLYDKIIWINNIKPNLQFKKKLNTIFVQYINFNFKNSELDKLDNLEFNLPSIEEIKEISKER